MKKSMRIVLILVLLGASLVTNCVQAVKEDKAGYLIISNSFCIIVRSPATQLTSSIGRSDLGVTLKDKITQISINGGYIAIAVPVAKIAETIRKYQLQKFTIIE
ncbi:MAG TPA: hypothetical protein DDW50_08270 [Firmicutes bacterium]|jgi:hypothetical protein|nr:hypothetical protein [Bacillota bacterium]